MYSFTNDYSEGAHPRILNALLETNLEQAAGYGLDQFTLEAAELIKRKIGRKDVDIHLIPGGTQTNLIAISAFLRPHEAVIAFMGGLAVFPGALTNRQRDDHYRAAMQGVLPDPDAPQGYGVFTGGTVHDAGGWRYHTFTESGTLGVVDPGFADVLVVDGGAGGAGGGGGGGAVWEQFEVMIPTSQPVTVGAGGAAIQISPDVIDAQPGGASSLGTLVVGGTAGQGGSVDYEDILAKDGANGTTGGGGGISGAGGTGSEGGDGGAGSPNATGGGGGAGGDGGAAGGGGDPYQGGTGGVGIQSAITGDWYGGGGGGGGAAGGAGGAGGGGKGTGSTAAEPGAPNTGGGGGGGGGSFAGREGGTGIVVIRTKTPT